MAFPTLTFNASTGSDVAASGAGPAIALSGAAAATTAASPTVDLSVDAPDLSGVATDGSAVIWVDSSSGRQFSAIIAVDNILKTVTAANNYANTEGARNWGIGGKRPTWNDADSRRIFIDSSAAWTIQTETDQTITATTITFSAAGDTTSGSIIVQGTSVAPRPIINITANAAIFTMSGTGVKYKDLQFTNSNATKTNANVVSSGSGISVGFINCIIGDSTNQLESAYVRTGNNQSYQFADCEINNCTSFGISNGVNAGTILVVGCSIHNNGAGGISGSTGGPGMRIFDSIIWANVGSGYTSSTGSLTLIGNTIHGNTGAAADGVNLTSSAASNLIVYNNNITGNGRYGLNTPTSGDMTKILVNNNNYGSGSTANGSGAVNNITLGAESITVDPAYVSAATGDFRVGVTVASKGFPLDPRTIGGNTSLTNSFTDIGASQRRPPPPFII